MNDQILAWLNDAYAMEKAIEEVLERQVNDASDYPDVQSKLQEHLEVTRDQAERVKGLVENSGGSISTVKTVLANMFGMQQGMMNRPFQDTLLKDAIADFAVEHFEIASYRALIDAARQAGEDQVAVTCEEILREEEEMASWLESQLPAVVRDAIDRAA